MQVVCALSYRASPFLPITIHNNTTMTLIWIVSMILFFIISPYIYYYIEGLHHPNTRPKYHGLPKTSNYGPKYLQNRDFTKRMGFDPPEALTLHGIFKIPHCMVHFPLRCILHCTLHSIKCRVFAKI